MLGNLRLYVPPNFSRALQPLQRDSFGFDEGREALNSLSPPPHVRARESSSPCPSPMSVVLVNSYNELLRGFAVDEWLGAIVRTFDADLFW